MVFLPPAHPEIRLLLINMANFSGADPPIGRWWHPPKCWKMLENICNQFHIGIFCKSGKNLLLKNVAFAELPEASFAPGWPCSTTGWFKLKYSTAGCTTALPGRFIETPQRVLSSTLPALYHWLAQIVTSSTVTLIGSLYHCLYHCFTTGWFQL